jgi:hypothetical protein
MSWNGIKNGPPLPPSKDNGSKGGKVNFSKNEASSKSIGNKGSGDTRGIAEKKDFKALSFVPKTVSKIDHNKPSTYGPAPKGGVTKKGK